MQYRSILKIASLRSLIREGQESFRANSLFRNSVFLMASTAIMSVLGFGFWIFVAHLYSPSQIGLAASLISITALLTNLSMVGMNAGLIRFLPKSKYPSSDINAAILLVTAFSVLAALAYIVVGSRLGANVSYFSSSLPRTLLFLLITAVIAVNSLTDAVFIANRRAEYHTIVYSIFGFSRLLLPIFLVGFGAGGIVSSFIIATVISLLLSFYFMVRACDYHFLSKPNWRLIANTKAFALNNYFAVLFAGIPAQILPLLIIKQLGAPSAAFFSMGWMIANLMYVIPNSSAQSLLAESSHDPNKATIHLKQTLRTLMIILLPAIVISVIAAPYLLRIFGSQYAEGSTRLFQILSIATIFVAVNIISTTVLNIQQRSVGVLLSQLLGTIVTLSSVTWLFRFGLSGVGVSLALGTVMSNMTQLYLFRKTIFFKNRAIKPAPDLRLALLTNGIVRESLSRYGITDSTFELLGNGSRNAAILVLSGSHEYVLKIYGRGAKSDEQIIRELDFVKMLSDAGICVPSILLTQSGKRFAKVKAGGYVWQSMLMERALGEHPQTYDRTLVTQMAELQARIHICGRSFAQLNNKSYNKAAKLNAAGFKPSRFIRTTQGFSHFDFDASNLLVLNGKISSVLDFEGMRYGSFVVCIFFTLNKLYCKEASTMLVKVYLDRYQAIKKLSYLELMLLKLGLTFTFKQPQILFLKLKATPNQSLAAQA